MNSGIPRDPLQSYIDDLLIDDLLGDTALDGAHRIGAENMQQSEGTLKLAAGGNVAPLPSALPARIVPAARPYAEPIRTLNLRMPLPPVAPPPAAEPSPIVETKQTVEAKQLVETKPAVETKQIAETRQRINTESKSVSPPAPVKPAVALAEPEPAASEPVIETPVATDLSMMAPPAAWLSNGRPQWAQQPFECLIFKAGGLQLAAPLVELGSIYPLESEALTEIFGQTQWFMGLLPVKEYNVRAMDTALVVMPERYGAAMRDDYRYVVSLFGSDWGLAVEAVIGTTLLDPDRVRWRGERSKRPWLAGTLIDQMCALFDIAQLAWLFHNQDRKRAPKQR
jgi:purine-binding chemotaxis protein CheW